MKTATRYNRKIRDAGANLVIHVKAQDIKGAVCRDHQKCVVAKAIMRQRKSTAKWVDVGNCVVLIGTSDKAGRRYLLNGQAKEQVRFFDENDGRFAPCRLSLAAPKLGGGKYEGKLGERAGEKPGGRIRKKSKRRQPTR